MKTLAIIFVTICMYTHVQSQYCGNYYNWDYVPVDTLVPGSGFATDLPCVLAGSYTNVVVEFSMFNTIQHNGTQQVDSIEFLAINNLPCAYCWSTNKLSNRFAANENGYVKFISHGSVGFFSTVYRLNLHLKVWVNGSTTPIIMPAPVVEQTGIKLWLRIRGNVLASCAQGTTTSVSTCLNDSLQIQLADTVTLCKNVWTTVNPGILGGIPPYTYSWSGTGDALNCSNCVGNDVFITQNSVYTVTVTDSANTTATATVYYNAIDCNTAQCNNQGRYQSFVFPNIVVDTVPYSTANGQTLKMAIFQPKDDQLNKRPVIILAHYSKLALGNEDKNEDTTITALCINFAHRGYVTASIDYRHAYGIFGAPPMIERLIDGISDAKAAVRFFRKDAATANIYKIDTGLIFGGGHAGGAAVFLQYAYADNIQEYSGAESAYIASTGGIEGNSGNAGYSSALTAVINLAGGMQALQAINAGGVPSVNFQSDSDDINNAPTFSYSCKEYGGPIFCGLSTLDSLYSLHNIPHVSKAFNSTEEKPWQLRGTSYGIEDFIAVDSIITDFLFDYTCKIANCPTQCVWPGDADYDGLADNNDLLNIGLAYGATGPVRPNATLNWEPQAMQNWSDSIGDANYKHIDCNGDGAINADDTLAILLNFNLEHPRSGEDEWRAENPVLRASIVQDTITNNDSLIVNLLLGDALNPATDVYGLAFTVNYDPLTVDTALTRITFGDSWLGNASDKISISKDVTDIGQIKCGITRIDHASRSGSGSIGTAIFVITTDNINGKDLAYYTNHIWISDITAIDEEGNILDINAGRDSATIAYEITGINDIAWADKISMYPNPASNILNINSPQVMVNTVAITNLLGEQLMLTNVRANKASINTETLQPGIYFTTVSTAKGNMTKKVAITK